MDIALTWNQIGLLLAAAVILIAVQVFLGRKGKQKESFILIAVPLLFSILFSIYAFFFTEFPEGGRIVTVFSYFIRINIITIMLAAVHSLYFTPKNLPKPKNVKKK
ncbi:hypothetical protein [Methanimicrococcus blatticola]|uniref:Uncharacterized protein n=1 Tax=Methanimicrococcus blatticola TaxID=91560 RepID=A0A484F6F2_9EURY|nr:hypothetical protein [Methanimicrococcus blatticola]MBZ3934913.1 hypothetical protein [Methanimicrococcus blatticola]MCC2508988.1 hypothetical protein [Methanimicrococcus blatticola]TDQ70982.1 hypothetical protein C7391_0080 [Methanimicrococcus blatticola]